jgi:hypothetical protein
MLRLVFGVFLVVCLKGGVLNAQVLLENDSVFVSSQSILTDSIELQPDTLTPIDSLILI